jgi:UDP-N-acetylglucosamine acyltransferase
MEENFLMKMSSDGNIIHSTAIISKSVKLGKNNFIGAYCVITGNVEIGDNNRFESHVCIGSVAQHRNKEFKPFGVKIGSNNVIREFVTIHSGIENVTIIKNDCYLMNYVHVPHDCIMGNSVTIANSTQIGGHAIIEDYCNIGLNATIHQFSYLGEGAMIGMGTVIPKNKRILPYKTYVGNPCKEIKDNEHLIQKNNIQLFDLLEMRKVYNSFFNGKFIK